MKKTVAFFSLLITCVAMFAQSGPTFPYQAVVRNSQNQLIKDSTFAIGVEVYQGADLKFSETQSVTTNANGQFTMNIGGGTLVSGAMADVADWSVAKFKITYHLSEGDIVSENAVRPVPYALQAANATDLSELLAAVNARMDSLGHVVDSLSNLNHGGGTTAFTCGTSKVKDVDGNEYNTVQIGNQCWMAQNLRTKTHQYGNVWTKTDVDSAIYGRYYDWAAVMQGESGNTVQGICPTGWHVPSDVEWDTLTTYVNSVADYKCEGTNNYIAKALASKTGWNASGNSCAVGNNLEHNNATGFSVVPSGYYSSNNATCFNFGDYAFLWSATEGESGKVLCRELNRGAYQVHSTNEEKNYGFSVRCLRDAGTSGNTPSTPATMSCDEVMNCMGDTLGRLNAMIEAQGAEIETLNGTVTAQGNTITTQGQTIETLNSTVESQGNTIDSLGHIVDSLSNLPHGGGNTPSAIFFCDSSTVKDVDQNEYHTVAIGNQCWMKENLRTKTHTYGSVSTNPDVDSVIYGRYYDWEAIMQVADANSSDFTPSGLHQGICPTGWHVPSQAEWNTLISYVSSVADYQCGDSDDNIANALSTATGWESPDGCCAGHTSTTLNKTGFSAVPAGYKFSQTDNYEMNGKLTFFGSATQNNNIGVHILYLRNDELSTSTAAAALKMDGISVRCLRDAGLVGNAGSNESGIGGGSNPTTAFTCGTSKVKDVENNEYNTVLIGEQCWMKENLRTSTNTASIGNIYAPTASEVPGYDVNTYGRFYDWAAMMQGASSTNYPVFGNKVQGICPTGWHVPSDAEWTQLTNYVSSQSQYCCNGNTNDIAKALASTSGWDVSPNTCAVGNNISGNNATGFSALPAGNYTYSNGSFGVRAYFWSATENSSDYAYYRNLDYQHAEVNRNNPYKAYSYSVRCLRD